MQSLQAKQRYLREKIPASQYEEFSAYLEEHVGNEDIDRWSDVFVLEIVQDYLRSREKDSSPLETSFYLYQHANDHPPKPSIDPRLLSKAKQEGNRQKQDQNKAKQDPVRVKENLKISKAETASMDVKPTSALHLFDSVFDSTNKSTKNQPQQSQRAIASKPVQEVAKFNAFDNNGFWSSVSATSKSGSNANNNKLSKSNVDFTSFDFWSQPQPKTANIDPPLSVRVQPTNEKPKSSVIPSFDELILQMKEEVIDNRGEKEERRMEREKEGKAPSPYQRKNYPQQQVATPAINTAKVSYEGEIVFKSDFKDSVKCFPSAERKELKGKELSVAVEGHQVVNRTFLMPDYVMYSIRVKPLNTLIQRNYEDFTRLRAVLADFYPGTKLAHLEGNSWFGATGAEQVKRQKVMLEFFLNDLLRNKEACNSRFIEDFLTLADHKRIKRKFEEFDQLERPKSIEELCLLQGRVHVNLSEQQRQYQEHLKKYQERMVDFLDRQERLSQALAEQYRTLGNTLQAMIDLTTSIIEETKRFNERVYGLEVQGVEEVLKVVRGCYAEEKKLAGFNLDLVTNCQLPFLSYERSNTKELDELITNQQSFLRSYLKRSEVEKVDPAMPYTSDKLAHSKAAVGTESKNIIVLKYQAGFFGNQLCHEAKRTFETLSVKFRELWGRIAMRKQEQCLRSLDFWKTLDAPMASFS